MAKQLKTWTALGLAAMGSAGLAMTSVAEADQSPAMGPSFLVAQAEAGEGGEGSEGGEGGEDGGAAPSSYALASTDPNAYKYEARPQIEAYADLVRTSYEKSAEEARKLKAAVDKFLAAPSADSLAAARTAWVEARPAYLKTEAFRFYDGPIEDVEGNLNAWPLNEAYIDYVEGNPQAGLVNDAAAPLDIAGLEKLNQKQDEADVTVGWHAIEFLLWGQDVSASGPGNRPFTDYIPGQGNNDRRRAYLKMLTGELAHELEELAGEWDSGKQGSYATKFLSQPPREAIGRIINGMAILAGFEFMSERLGVALDSGDQEDEHSCFSDTTKQDFAGNLRGLIQVWTGDNVVGKRPGLNELVYGIDPAMAQKVDRLFADAEAKVNALGDPWDQVLASPKDSPQRKAAEDLVAALQNLADGLVETGNKLGVIVMVPNG